MNILWFILLGISFISLGALVIWLLITIFGEKEKKVDNPIALNFLAKRDNGRFIGEEISRSTGKNGRHLCIISPKDISIKNLKDKIPDETVIVDKNKLLSISRGALSKDKNINLYLPATIDDIDSSIRTTPLGLALAYLTMLKDVEKTVEDILREGAMRRDLLLQKIGSGEISKEFINFQEGLVKDYLEHVINPRDLKEKPSTYSSNVGNIGQT